MASLTILHKSDLHYGSTSAAMASLRVGSNADVESLVVICAAIELIVMLRQG